MFKERARESELPDHPDADPRLVEAGYRFMNTVNRVGGGIRVVRRFLEREVSASANGHPVTVLDIGAGDCAIALEVAHWAERRGLRVRFTCLDHEAKAVELAQRAMTQRAGPGLPRLAGPEEGGPAQPAIRVVHADVFTYRPAEEFDYAIGSMTFHHFTDDQIHRLIAHLRGFVRKALLINDLHRCLPNYLACLALALPIDPVIRHDGLLSIRRGFKPRELTRMLARHDPRATVTTQWFCRIAGIVRFDRE